MPRASSRQLTQRFVEPAPGCLERFDGARIVGQPARQSAQLNRERHESLLGAVVQIPLEPSSLVLRDLDDARPGPPQLLDPCAKLRLESRVLECYSRCGYDPIEKWFRSERVELAENGTATVEGELTIKGISQPITATGTWERPVEDTFGSLRAALELRAVLDRRDRGLTWQMPLPGGADVLGWDVEERARLGLASLSRQLPAREAVGGGRRQHQPLRRRLGAGRAAQSGKRRSGRE
jgi:hypothetical protein